jgi:integrase
MKGKAAQRANPSYEFIVPLPRQAVDIVRAALSLSNGAPLLFPSNRHAHRPMSDNALSVMYRRLPEFAGRHVPHGWRSTFSTIMNERAQQLDRPGDRAVIDLMLAHAPSGTEAVYNRAAYMKRRRELAQEWADLLLEGLPPASTLLDGPRC